MRTRLLYTLLAVQMLGLVALYAWHQAGLGYPSVMLKTLPVDPRDPLRGDYIILNYEISRVPEDFNHQEHEGREVFVILKDVGGFAAVERVQLWDPGYGERFIKGRVKGTRIEYDLEKFFVPEGKGNPPLPITVEVSLRGDGHAQIKRLFSQGKPWP
ncbi:MAG: GDYXXLXY domain-containing protein [Candidatus Methylacidiphilales bacterium]|nr:GDYXXLXY domain-containing protein [Candidatus Methylacidiphilales bacterium]